MLLGRSAEVQHADLPVKRDPGAAARAGAALEGGVLPIREVQRRYAAWALEKMGGRKARTAEALGVDGKTLAKWLGSAE